MKKRLAIIGSGDLGQLISYHAKVDSGYEIAGFFDDYKTVGEIVGNGIVLGGLGDVTQSYQAKHFDVLMIGIGYNHMQIRKSTYEKFVTQIPFAKIVHSSSYVDSSSKLGDGVFILPGCTVDTGVVIGNNVLLNTGVVIAHDTTIENHCFISPAVSIAGKSLIKECCVLGINSTIIDNITIEPNIKIAGGSVVTKSLTSSGLYAGVPAIYKKKL